MIRSREQLTEALAECRELERQIVGIRNRFRKASDKSHRVSLIKPLLRQIREIETQVDEYTDWILAQGR